MRRSWTRLAVAFFCVVLVLFVTMTAKGGSDHLSATLPPIWLLFAAVTAVVVRRGALPCDEQPVSLRSVVLFRAPPAGLSRA